MKIAVGSLLLLATLVQCRFRTGSHMQSFRQNVYSPPVRQGKRDICIALIRSNEKAYTACKKIMETWLSCQFVANIMTTNHESMVVAARHIYDHLCGSPGGGVTPPRVTPPGAVSLPRDRTCGQSPVLRRREPLMNVGGGGGGGLGRIVGGEDTKGCSTIPWQVQINANYGLCGGSIISPNHVLTAAHCMAEFKNKPQLVVVRAADYDLYAKEEKIVGVTKIAVHERYINETDLRNDIAILTLNESLQFSKCMTPICLDPTFVPDGHYCVVAGWGHDKVFGEVSDVLKMVRVKAYKGTDCTKVFEPYSPDYMKDETSTICAGYIERGIGTCHGDSGGPLVCWSNGRYVQAGLVSYSEGCAWARSPTVYTSVPFYHNWIKDKMNSRFP